MAVVGRIALVLGVVAAVQSTPAHGLEPPAVALPAASTAHDLKANGDDSTWAGAGAVELGVFQAVHGSVAGLELCQFLRCRAEDLPAFLFLGTGVGAGVGTAVGLKLRPHQAMLVNSGTALGFLHGLALSYSDSGNQTASTLLASQLVGTVAGGVASQLLHPDNGRIAMANSTALWTATVMALSRRAGERPSIGAWTMGAADLGFLFGWFAWDSKPLPRARVAIIDIGAAAGLAIGAVAGTFVEAVHSDSNAALWGAAAGTLGGAVLGALVAPLPDTPLNVQVIPQSNGLALVGGF